MTTQEKLKRDIDTLRQSIQRDWLEMDLNMFNASARQALHQHIDACVSDLTELLNRLDKLNDDRP